MNQSSENGAQATLTRVSPVEAASRLIAMDVARGLALLGIFFVNIQLFAMPFGSFMQRAPENNDALTVFFYYLVKTFCEGKFYTLFSMLFGMGLVLQMHSVMGRGGRFYAVYIRRLLWLFIMGLSHALLLWYGDILFVYSLCGVVLMLSARARPKVLIGVGAGLVVFGAVAQTGLTAIGLVSQQQQQREVVAAEATPGDTAAPPQTDAAADEQPELPGADPVPADAEPAAPTTDEANAVEKRAPFIRFIESFQTNPGQQPDSPIWMETETEAYRDGPYLQAFLFRATSWAMMIVVFFFGFGWHVLGMFFIGAGLLKSGLLSPAGAAWQARLALVGLLVGVPAAAGSAVLHSSGSGSWALMSLSVLLLMLSGPLVALMYLCTVAIIVRNGLLAPVTWVLANVGRMALTNYIMQTVIATFVFYHWGLAQFGSWSRPERCGLVLAVFVAQCIISPIWLSVFRFGPLEWVWRSITYLRPQPMLRNRGGSSAE